MEKSKLIKIIIKYFSILSEELTYMFHMIGIVINVNIKISPVDLNVIGAKIKKIQIVG